MTATFTEKRRTSPTPPRPLRELPVLFHLMDVSRPKGFSAPPPAFSLDAEDEPSALGSAESFDLETAAKLVETKAYGSLPAEVAGPAQDSPALAPAAPDPATQVSLPPAEDLAGSEPSTNSNATGSAEAPAATETSAEPKLETPPPGDEGVSLRQRTEERQRKRQNDKQDDWFHTQGRYIAIGFVLALLATIYLARTNRKSSAPPVAAKNKPAATAPGKTAPAAKKPAASVATTAAITAVRPTEKSPADQPQAALHPPAVPQLAQEPATSTAPATETLFTFSKSADDRLAARTDVTASTQPTSAASPAPSPAPSAPTDPPNLQPQYPSTSFPGTYQPVAPATPTTTPAAEPATSPYGSTPLYPTTNSASGIRYERTGSSIY
jgi:hypothetical protein